MANFKKEELARMEGMVYALRIAKKDGIEELEKEIKKRGITGISINCSHKELENASVNMRNMMFDTFMCFTIGILHDCFGFGQNRARKFQEKFMEGSELLAAGTISWEEIIEATEDALKMKLHIRKNDTNTQIKRIY